MTKVAKAYSDISVETSMFSKEKKPLELILLVFEKIFDHLTIGKRELENGENGVEYFSKAVDLLNLGLIASLNKAKGGQIAENLELIYLYAIQKIIEARLHKNPDKIDEAIKVLNPIYVGWSDLKLKVKN
jgi:flagellar protein FliS